MMERSGGDGGAKLVRDIGVQAGLGQVDLFQVAGFGLGEPLFELQVQIQIDEGNDRNPVQHVGPPGRPPGW